MLGWGTLYVTQTKSLSKSNSYRVGGKAGNKQERKQDKEGAGTELVKSETSVWLLSCC